MKYLLSPDLELLFLLLCSHRQVVVRHLLLGPTLEGLRPTLEGLRPLLEGLRPLLEGLVPPLFLATL